MDWASLGRTDWLVLGNLVLYAACFQMQAPALPFLVKELGVAASDFAWLRSCFALLQLAGSLVSGPLIDAFGVRAVLLLTFGVSAAHYALTASAHTLVALYLALVPTVLQHAMLAARAYVALSAPGPALAVRLGFTGVAYGVGVVLGPAVGGFVTDAAGPRVAAWIAALGSLASLASVALSMPPLRAAPSDAGPAPVPVSLRKQRSAQPDAAPTPAPPTSFLAHLGVAASLVARSPAARSLLGAKLLLAGSIALVHSLLSMFATDTYGLDARGLGLLMSYVGLLGMVVQAWGVAAARRRWRTQPLSAGCAVVAALGCVALAMASSPLGLALAATPLTVASTLLAALNGAALAASAPPHAKGAMAAWDMAAGSAVRLVAPLVVGAAAGGGGAGAGAAVGVGGAALSGALALWLWVDPAAAGGEGLDAHQA
jgi:MFS family permease